MRTLNESTDIPRLWDIFSRIILIGGVSKFGFNLSGFNTYALGLTDLGINIDHNTFWNVMTYFLSERNSEFHRKMNRGKRG